ncbi:MULTISPECIES: hypothetical protein [unclassified Wolbachia]|uniref:hypothetical protein n=1 Tax=unclassified Wolbachia TaxID=2640676 RepID=UPI00124FB043|nr:hypothetical protein [Wolbachia endosymbiont of Nasonia oneida]KAB2977736.1 hypothetical protein DEF52_05585 [Wolbachia endosymbiont of Nasonia oneida]
MSFERGLFSSLDVPSISLFNSSYNFFCSKLKKHSATSKVPLSSAICRGVFPLLSFIALLIIV